MVAVVRLVALLTLTLVVWSQPVAPASEATLTLLRQLLDNKKLLVAMIDTDYPPLFTTRQNGQLAGHDIELARQLAKELGVQVEFVRQSRSFDAVIDVISRGEADIGLGTSITLARAKKVLFSHPYLTLNMALLLNRRRLIEEGIISELSELAQLRHTTAKIGLLVGSSYKDYARKTFPQAELQEYPSLSSLLRSVRQGDILAAVRNDLTARLYLHSHPATILQLQLFVDERNKDYVAFSVHPSNAHLLFWLNTYLTLKGVSRTTQELLDTLDGWRN